MWRRLHVVCFGLSVVALTSVCGVSLDAYAQVPDEEITDDDELEDALPVDEEETTDDEDDLVGDEEPPPPVAPPRAPPTDLVPIDDNGEPPPSAPPIPVDDDPPAAPPRATLPPPLPPRPPPIRPVRARPLDLPTIEKPEVMTERDLLEHIESRANYVRLGESSEAAVELAYIEEARRAIGARNVVVASAVLIREVQTALDAGLLDHAIELAEAASRLSPDVAATHWMRARSYWAQDKAQLARLAGAVLGIARAKVFGFRNVVSLLSNIAALIGLSLLATIVMFAAAQLLKYIRYPAHDFASIWPSFVGTGEAIMLILILITLPATFGFGMLPGVALALALVMAYQTKAERRVGAAMLVMLGLSPAMLYFSAPLVTYHGSVTDAMASAVSDAFTADAEASLREHMTKRRNDFSASVILAHRIRQRGDFEQAALEYERALRASPQSALARNNLGVVQYLLGREQQALATFRAATASRELAEPFLNLASMVVEDAHFEEANRYLESARAIDPDLTLYYTQLDGGLPTAQKMLEARVGQSLLWERLFDVDPKESIAVGMELWGPIGGRTPPLGMPVVVFVAGLIGLAMMRLSARLSIPCPRCGIPADRGSPAHFCAQCISVFLTAVAVEPKVRAVKEHAVRKHQRGLRYSERLLSIIAGAGHMYGRRPLLGSVIAFFFFIALGTALFPQGFVVNRWDLFIDATAQSVSVIIALAFTGILALFSLRASFQ